VTGIPAAEESLRRSERAASDLGRYKRESESLGNAIDNMRQTLGETDPDIMKLRSTKEQYLKKFNHIDIEASRAFHDADQLAKS